MKTKRLSRYCLLLFMSLLVVCCREDDLIPSDLPVEQESAKDNLPWPLYQNMDTENGRMYRILVEIIVPAIISICTATAIIGKPPTWRVRELSGFTIRKWWLR